MPAVEHKPWAQLTLHERRAAETIELSAWRWDRRVHHALKSRISNVVEQMGVSAATPTPTRPVRVAGGVATRHDYSQREAEREADREAERSDECEAAGVPRVAHAVGAMASPPSTIAPEIRVTNVRVNRNGSISYQRLPETPQQAS